MMTTTTPTMIPPGPKCNFFQSSLFSTRLYQGPKLPQIVFDNSPSSLPFFSHLVYYPPNAQTSLIKLSLHNQSNASNSINPAFSLLPNQDCLNLCSNSWTVSLSTISFLVPFPFLFSGVFYNLNRTFLCIPKLCVFC
ncbi:hypothetical protein CPB86DRAFT_359022 [Serendipita vermifera]|nr:hypothetical protein CPB86DRAFT_359022 [Serendipita vermifera]